MNFNINDIVYDDVVAVSETMYRRHLTVPYCMGNGVDLGSGGSPVVPWAIQLEYHQAPHFGQRINYIGDATQLPFKDETLDFVYASHLLEDFLDWRPILNEWNRVLKVSGNIIIMVPDHQVFRQCVLNGQDDNLAHKHESYPGELTSFYNTNYKNFEVIHDYITDSYNILFVAKKLE
jgi:predicted SAM-dependent methyltransferase